ncbi:MAG: hypothetical protein KF744_09270 [Taibaiella sp.]|nr:hypothetical protein [Taibaiella sp.]
MKYTLLIIVPLILIASCKQKKVDKKDLSNLNLKEKVHSLNEPFVFNGFMVTVTAKELIKPNNYTYYSSWMRRGCNYLKVTLQAKNITHAPAVVGGPLMTMSNQQGAFLYNGVELTGNSHSLRDEINPLVTESSEIFYELPSDVQGNFFMFFLDDSTKHTLDLGQNY